MKLESAYTFAGPRDTVWDLMLDPEVLKKALPGTEKLEQTTDDVYEGIMKVRVGPLSGQFNVKVTISDKSHPENYTMVVEGKSALGFVKGTARVNLQEESGDATRMDYAADLNIGGKLAIVGQRLLDTVGKSMTQKSLEAMSQALQERLAGK